MSKQPKNRRRKICVVITDKAQVSRLLTLLAALKHSPHFKLQIIVGGGALTYRYGNILQTMKKAGFKVTAMIPTVIENSNYVGMAKTAGLTMLESATVLHNLRPDIVVVRGDRFEMLPVAAAAAYLNILVVHLEGGDRTGSIDESVRHAITKLAHLHFVTHEAARKRVIRLGEIPAHVFDVGSLDIDFLSTVRWRSRLSDTLVNSHGTGAKLHLRDAYIVVMFNPVTSEAAEARSQVEETLAAVWASGLQAVWIWPNLGAGSEAIAKRMREWQNEHTNNARIRFIRYLSPADFANLIRQAKAVVGNSSTGIKECGWLGVPAVNIGTRQAGRERGRNVLDAPYDRTRIAAAIKSQVQHGLYPSSRLYGNGKTARAIVSRLQKLDPPRQKYNSY